MLLDRVFQVKFYLAAELDVRFLTCRVARDAEFFDLRPDIWL